MYWNIVKYEDDIGQVIVAPFNYKHLSDLLKPYKKIGYKFIKAAPMLKDLRKFYMVDGKIISR